MCFHKWSLWSQVFQVADYFAQRRVCEKCGQAEMREVHVQMGKGR